MRYIRLAILFVITVSGATAADKPQWLNGQGKDYPESKFLTAVGKGADIVAARDNATAKIAANFKLQMDDKNTAPYLRTEFNKVLDKIEFAGQWHDDASEQCFVYAVLSHHQAATGLWEGMRFHDQYTQAQLAFSRREADHFVSAQSFYKAYLSQLTRADLFQQAKALRSGKEPVGPSMTPESLKRDMAHELSQMRVTVEITNDADKNLTALLRKWVTESGMLYERKQPAYRVQAEWAGANTAQQGNVQYRHDGTLDVTLLREKDKKIMARRQIPLNVAAESAKKAEKQLQKRIEETIEEQLLTTLLTYQAPVMPLRGRPGKHGGANPHASSRHND